MCSVLVLFVVHIVVYYAPVGGWCVKSPQFSCLLRRFLKLDGLTKDGNPYGWLALGRGARGRGFGGQATFIGWKRSVFKTHARVPYKVYNSVPVVLYLKPFRTTGCTS